MWSVFMETILFAKMFVTQNIPIDLRFTGSDPKYGISIPNCSIVNN